MLNQRSYSHFNETAASSKGGCLSIYLLPPLAVISIGALVIALVLATPAAPASAQIPEQTLEPSVGNLLSPISPVFTPEVQFWAVRIGSWASTAGLDPNLVATVMQIESCGDPRAVSRSGAMGLFQVMPYHFTSSDDPYAPDTNALRGTDYLRRSMDAAQGNARLALAGYNGGIGVIDWAETAWPVQTQNYAYWGSGIYSDSSSAASDSPRLQEWLAANGISLCRQAHTRLGLIP